MSHYNNLMECMASFSALHGKEIVESVIDKISRFIASEDDIHMCSRCLLYDRNTIDGITPCRYACNRAYCNDCIVSLGGKCACGGRICESEDVDRIRKLTVGGVSDEESESDNSCKDEELIDVPTLGVYNENDQLMLRRYFESVKDFVVFDEDAKEDIYDQLADPAGVFGHADNIRYICKKLGCPIPDWFVKKYQHLFNSAEWPKEWAHCEGRTNVPSSHTLEPCVEEEEPIDKESESILDGIYSCENLHATLSELNAKELKPTKSFDMILKLQKHALSLPEYPKLDSLWRHYKGGLYKVKFLSMRENDQAILVNYLHCNDDNTLPMLWSRPAIEWNTPVGMDLKPRYTAEKTWNNVFQVDATPLSLPGKTVESLLAIGREKL